MNPEYFLEKSRGFCKSTFEGIFEDLKGSLFRVVSSLFRRDVLNHE